MPKRIAYMPRRIVFLILCGLERLSGSEIVQREQPSSETQYGINVSYVPFPFVFFVICSEEKKQKQITLPLTGGRFICKVSKGVN